MLSFLASLEMNGVQSETQVGPQKRSHSHPMAKGLCSTQAGTPSFSAPSLAPSIPATLVSPSWSAPWSFSELAASKMPTTLSTVRPPVLLRVQEERRAPPKYPFTAVSSASSHGQVFSRRKWSAIYSFPQ